MFWDTAAPDNISCRYDKISFNTNTEKKPKIYFATKIHADRYNNSSSGRLTFSAKKNEFVTQWNIDENMIEKGKVLGESSFRKVRCACECLNLQVSLISIFSNYAK